MPSIAKQLFEAGELVRWIPSIDDEWVNPDKLGTQPRELYGHGPFWIYAVTEDKRPIALHPQEIQVICRIKDGSSAMIVPLALSGYWFEKVPERKVEIFHADDMIRVRTEMSLADSLRAYHGEGGRPLDQKYGTNWFRVEKVEFNPCSWEGECAHPQWVTIDRRDCTNGVWRRSSPGIPRLSGFFLERMKEEHHEKERS